MTCHNPITIPPTFQKLKQRLEAAILHAENETSYLQQQTQRHLQNAATLRQQLETLELIESAQELGGEVHPVASNAAMLLADDNQPVILDEDYLKLLDLYSGEDYQ